MEYQLEIYRPGGCGNNGTLKTFAAATPFLPIRVGDLLNTSKWGEQVEWPLLRVLNVEHLISENPSAGIDPAGRVVHQVLLYTEDVPDSPDSRCKPLTKVPKRSSTRKLPSSHGRVP